MKILHVVPDLAVEGGGPSTAILSLCEGLVELGAEVSLVTTDFSLNGRKLPKGLDLQIFHCVLPRWRWSPAISRALRSLLSVVDVVHIHGVWLHPIWAAARLSRLMAIPYILRPCGMLESWSLSQRAWRKRIYSVLLEGQTIRHAAAIHFTDETEQIKSTIRGAAPSACVIPLAVPRESYENLPPPGTFRSRYPALDQKRIVLFLGRLHYKKRPELLIRAVREVAVEFPNAVLVFAGPGEPHYVSTLRSLAQQLGMNGRVVFIGLLQGRAVREAFVDADLFVLPSLQENFGLAVAEAMAAGCPVVVTPEVALARQIEDYSAGLVVKGEVGTLGGAISLVLRDEPLRLAMGRNGRRLILDRFTWNRVSLQILGVYQDIVKGTRSSPAWR